MKTPAQVSRKKSQEQQTPGFDWPPNQPMDVVYANPIKCIITHFKTVAESKIYGQSWLWQNIWTNHGRKHSVGYL